LDELGNVRSFFIGLQEKFLSCIVEELDFRGLDFVSFSVRNNFGFPVDFHVTCDDESLRNSIEDAFELGSLLLDQIRCHKLVHFSSLGDVGEENYYD